MPEDNNEANMAEFKKIFNELKPGDFAKVENLKMRLRGNVFRRGSKQRATSARIKQIEKRFYPENYIAVEDVEDIVHILDLRRFSGKFKEHALLT